MSEWLEYEVTWTDPDGSPQVYEANGRDLAAERDALQRARAILDRGRLDLPVPNDVVIKHRTVISSAGPWTSQRVDLSVVEPALERTKRTARITPSAVTLGPPVRTMADGSQEYGPYSGLEPGGSCRS